MKKIKNLINKGVILIVIIGLLIGASTLPITGATRDGITIHVYPGSGTPLQDGINLAEDNDTVFVHSGTYYENIIIEASIKLVGENKRTTIIDGGGEGSVIQIESDSVTIRGFTIQNGGTMNHIWDAGILSLSYHNKINNNIITGSLTGVRLGTVYVSGEFLVERWACYNTVSCNDISNNVEGIGIKDGLYNDIIGNDITDNTRGIKLYATSTNSNHIYYNNFINNDDHAYDDGWSEVWDDGFDKGNYWDDWNGSGPYEIPPWSSEDRYPLSSPMNLIINLDTNEVFTTIQDAIDDADTIDEHTIFVSSGTYYENNILIDKSIDLVGEDKDTTFIDGNQAEENIIILDIPGVYYEGATITGFTIQNTDNYVIEFAEAHDCTISDCNIYGNNIGGGINCGGIIIFWHSNNIIDCIISENEVGFYICGCINMIHENTIIDNGLGLYIPGAEWSDIPTWHSDNHIYHNNFVNNDWHAIDEESVDGIVFNENYWDNGYPEGGNYWDNFDESTEGAFDGYHGENQDILGDDGIVDLGPPSGGLNPYYQMSRWGLSQDSYPLIESIHEHYRDITDFPIYLAEDSDEFNYNQLSGAAVAQSVLNYIWWNSIEDPDGPPMLFDDQEWLFDTMGRPYNWNPNIDYIDSQGMSLLLYDLKPDYYEYGYFFNRVHSQDPDHVLKNICVWMDYTIGWDGFGPKPGHPPHVPAIIPTYGGYSNWMVIRGIHTDKNAWPIPEELTVYGFWVNDPFPGGIGENTYKTADELLANYFFPLNSPNDLHNGEYLAIVEPPVDFDFTPLNNLELKRETPTEYLRHDDLSIMKNDFNIFREILDLTDKNTYSRIMDAAINAIDLILNLDNNLRDKFEKTKPIAILKVDNHDGDDYYIAILGSKTSSFAIRINENGGLLEFAYQDYSPDIYLKELGIKNTGKIINCIYHSGASLFYPKLV